MQRRTLLKHLPVLGLAAAGRESLAQPVRYAIVDPNYELVFPRDFGAHPDFRTEWWYITGWLALPNQQTIGLQITFFRSRTDFSLATQSRFAPRQLIFAHAALGDASRGILHHDQRAVRAHESIASVSSTDTDCKIGDWRLQRQPDDRYECKIQAYPGQTKKSFSIDLRFSTKSAPHLQGNKGFSQKGPQVTQASYYYSRPQLEVAGTMNLPGSQSQAVRGRAWLDHEWSSTLLDPAAVGWDWVGINLEDGGSLLAFQIRGKQSNQRIWSYFVIRDARGRVQSSAQGIQAARFSPTMRWRSAISQIEYPIAQRIILEPDSKSQRVLRIEPLFPAQEIDARLSTGGFYWEGASRLFDDETGSLLGRGYLEMTGYGGAIRL